MEFDTESWARLLGLMTQLASSNARVEVEVAPEHWERINRISITNGMILMANNLAEYQWMSKERFPSWRCAR